MRRYAHPLTADPGYAAMNLDRYADEPGQVRRLLADLDLPGPERAAILGRARGWAGAMRRAPGSAGRLDALLAAVLGQWGLDSREGLALLCLAESLPRIPDRATQDLLIADKLGGLRPGRQVYRSSTPLVNASLLALTLAGRLCEWVEDPDRAIRGALRRELGRAATPGIRRALHRVIGVLGDRFVMGATIADALARAAQGQESRYRHSFDMLGESARTAADARRYRARYLEAIGAVGAASGGLGPVAGPGVSVKLSALHPRLEPAQCERVRRALLPDLIELAQAAKGVGIGLTVDAEECARLDLTLDLFAALCAEPSLAGWDGLGIAVQAYQRRAPGVLDLLGGLAERHRRRIMVRLVKGAYWDTEIKLAQQQGLPDYPVYTRKVHTDLAYLACARRLLGLGSWVYPQFATHNAHTVAAVLALAGGRPCELQRLHGMGESLYDLVLRETGAACRAYDPVGERQDLLPYLVRRLLENGANSSFVHRIADTRTPADRIVTDPIEMVGTPWRDWAATIPAPRDLYRPDRVNAQGLDLGDPEACDALSAAMESAIESARVAPWRAEPLVRGSPLPGLERPVLDPADRRRIVGQVAESGPKALDAALAAAARAAPDWDRVPAARRAECLERAADLLEERLGLFVALCCREAGKTVPDGLAEVRESADFCRYYAARARERFGEPRLLPGPTGERNALSLHGRGVFACISPWNFPLAIFIGQVSAALAAGNAVVAKPAEQTPLIAAQATRLLLDAGIPPEVLHLLPGDGPTVGAPLVADPRVSGVVFTGSLPTARAINRTLAARDGPIVPLIAETGGQNAMIVDSSALPEQVLADVLASAFQSAGQRCSALRVLFLQEDIAERVIDMLAGGMAELVVGDPWDLAIDVGPVIDPESLARLETHCRRMEREARLIYRCPLPADTGHGTFFPPQAFEIDSLDRLAGEVFGPVLHVVRYRTADLDRVARDLDALGYGLTFGVHSRIDRTVALLTGRMRVGNQYVNRSLIGAVVGVQPFGGEGLSGTGPKAGGPDYLQRFAVERLVSTNTAAAGGNAELLALGER
jgi:RHH-type transcriptional regulator, proline utilization regulon repressor / proline dehydrogenase / delta 1-pyrroline-5-carboxylate dehydrogenase